MPSTEGMKLLETKRAFVSSIPFSILLNGTLLVVPWNPSLFPEIPEATLVVFHKTGTGIDGNDLGVLDTADVAASTGLAKFSYVSCPDD